MVIAGLGGLSPAISSKFTSRLCAFKVINVDSLPLKSLSAVLVMVSSKSMSICNRYHARRGNRGNITILGKNHPSLMPGCLFEA